MNLLRVPRAVLAAVGAFADELWPAVVPDDLLAEMEAETEVTEPPAGLSVPQASSPAGPSWAAWATPVICDVLAGHDACDCGGGVECSHQFSAEPFADWQEWREHVAPIIAERLETAENAARSDANRQADQRITKHLNAAGFEAAQTFTQYCKPTNERPHQ